jgi:hypothetical protein
MAEERANRRLALEDELEIADDTRPDAGGKRPDGASAPWRTAKR